MQADFRAPRRRNRVNEEYEAPLPVSRGPAERSHYRADLIDQHVLLCHADHIQKIHGQGFFGKGVLSRARPAHSIFDQWEQHEGLLLPVVSQARYEELLRWARSALAAQGLAEEAISQALLKLSQPVEMEDVRRKVGQESEGGICHNGKRLPTGSEVESEAKRSCRLDLNHHLTFDPDPVPEGDLDTDPEPVDDPDPDPELDDAPDPDPDDGPDSSPQQDHSLDADFDPSVPGPSFVLVVSSNDDDGVTQVIRQVRRTPISLTEYLQLSLEEAFFLCYSLGCLSVYQNQEPLSVIQLWRKLRSLRPDFVSSYAAYHHCRSRGWIPKGGGGAKYGVDFMLYRKGPPFYHASYSVVVERVDGTFKGSTLRPFSWRTLAALSRITANVSKELMLLYIIYPAMLGVAELDSPMCLSRLKVQEVLVNRWVSSRERAEQDDLI